MEDRLRRLSLRDTLLISVGLAAFYYFFIFNSPNVETRRAETQGKIRTIQAENTMMVETIERGPKIEEEIAAIKNETSRRAARFKMGMSPETVQRIISEEARAAGIFFESISDGRTGSGAPPPVARKVGGNAPDWFDIANYIRPFEISTSFSGNYAQVMRFLSYLTRTDDIITLKRLRISAGQLTPTDLTSGKSPPLRFDVTFEAYSLVTDVVADSLKPVGEAGGGAR